MIIYNDGFIGTYEIGHFMKSLKYDVKVVLSSLEMSVIEKKKNLMPFEAYILTMYTSNIMQLFDLNK